MALVLASGLVCAAAISDWRIKPLRCGTTCAQNIRQVALALSQYHEAYRCFPPAYVADDRGTPLYSWRVLILPFMDQGDIYNSFNLGQSWDSPENRPLSQTYIKAFRCPHSGGDWKTFSTSYVVITGKDTLFPAGKITSIANISKDPSSAILVAEVADSSIHWAEPKDLDRDTMSFLVNDASRPSLGSNHEGGPYVAFVDATVRQLDSSRSPAVVKAMTTRHGGETIDPRSFERRESNRGKALRLNTHSP